MDTISSEEFGTEMNSSKSEILVDCRKERTSQL